MQQSVVTLTWKDTYSFSHFKKLHCDHDTIAYYQYKWMLPLKGISILKLYRLWTAIAVIYKRIKIIKDFFFLSFFSVLLQVLHKPNTLLSFWDNRYFHLLFAILDYRVALWFNHAGTQPFVHSPLPVGWGRELGGGKKVKPCGLR